VSRFVELPDFSRPIRRFVRWFPWWARGLVAFGVLWLGCSELVKALTPRPGDPQLGFWAALILLAVSVVAQEYLRPKPKLENARPAGIGDYKFPTATEGRPVPLLWGRARIDAPNLAWFGDVQQQAIVKRVRTGLWTTDSILTGYKNFVAMQLLLCRGGTATVALRGVWVGDTLVFSGNITATTQNAVTIDEPELFGGSDTGNGGFQADLDFFNGSNTQFVSDFLNTPDRQQIAVALTPTAPGYRGTCYVVVHEIGAVSIARGAYVGNSTDIQTMAFDLERTPALFPGQSAGQNKIGSAGDVNPINVIYEYLTDPEFGIGDSATDVDVGVGSSFVAASNAMIAEGNGFSFLLDTEREGEELLRELERQIDGVVFRSPSTGKWTIKLARADYDINTVPEFTPSNAKLRSYTQSGWEDTTNQVQVLFNKRDDDYKESNAIAQDSANAQIVGGGSVASSLLSPVQVRFPGVKVSALAAQLAWRELRTVAYPMARCTLEVDRAFWALELGSVVAWTWPRYGFVKLPMRVTAIDYGELDSATIVLTLVQDVFYFAAPSYAAPAATSWTPPVVQLVAYPAAQQLIIEAPRAIIIRDPLLTGQTGGVPRIDWNTNLPYGAAARQGSETGFRQYSRASPNPPTVAGKDVFQFMGIGTLGTALPRGQANPRSTIAVTAPSRFALEFDNQVTLEALGTGLAHLVMIGNEMMLVTSATWSSGTLTLNGVYRGALDTVQESHAPGALVYFLFFGADLFRNSFGYAQGYSVALNTALRAFTATEEFAGAVTTVTLPVGNRPSRPYPPAAILYNGSVTPFTSPSLEGAGSGIGGFRIDVAWWRRRYDTEDEVAALLSDDTGVLASSEYRLEVRADPLGANTLVGAVSAWTTGAGPLQVSRADILTAAAAGTLLRFLIRARHDFGPDFTGTTVNDLESRYDFAHDVVPTSALSGLFYFGGGLAANVASLSYTAAATGTFTLAIGAAQATATIQVSINGGAFATVITATTTSGTFSATSGDTIRVRRTVNEAPQPNYVELRNPSAAVVAYGTFKN